MAGRKRMIVGTIRTHHFGMNFQLPHHRRHDHSGKSIRNQHPSPRTSTFHASRFHSQHHGSRKILGIIIVTAAERRQISIPQLPEMIVFTFHDQPSDNKWDTDISHLISPRRSYLVYSPLKATLPGKDLYSIDLCMHTPRDR